MTSQIFPVCATQVALRTLLFTLLRCTPPKALQPPQQHDVATLSKALPAQQAQQAQHAKGRMHVVMHCMEELVWVAAQEEQRRVQQLQSFCSCFIVRSVGV
jgi:hypothetical protein